MRFPRLAINANEGAEQGGRGRGKGVRFQPDLGRRRAGARAFPNHEVSDRGSNKFGERSNSEILSSCANHNCTHASVELSPLSSIMMIERRPADAESREHQEAFGRNQFSQELWSNSLTGSQGQ